MGKGRELECRKMRRMKENMWLGRSDGPAVPRRTLVEIGYARPSLIHVKARRCKELGLL